jgi:predicted negative regulator of RcsB-dependent stress response
METAVKFLKDNVKVAVTVTVLGFTVVLGWAKGCTVTTAPAPAPVEQAAPVAP